ncbi:unnamed protein product [Clonostachys chloroleuca]|uniref:Rhodopsin domain-containing protein n=1 Tax=Clonostachys chloroleuca TaxID=1926264 RepID=A0AA35QG78_9HYPO|nr:unnamed protein product [Clonostachys chloroleuca]
MIELTPDANSNFLGCLIMIIVASLSVLCRVLLRISLSQKFLLADYLRFFSLFVFAGYCGLVFNYIFNISASGTFEATLITNPKVSMQEAQEFMKFITFFVSFLVQCRPISALGSSFGSSEFCMSMPELLLGFELTNLFIDVAILLIPTVMVGKLRLNAIKKVSVIGVFSAGVCVTSIARLTAIWNPPDVMANFDTAKGMLWSKLQVGMAIVCACLPTFSPIFFGKSKFGSHAKSWYGSLRDKRTQNSGYKMSDNQSSNGRPWADDENRFHASSRGGWRAQDDNAHETDSDHIPLDPLPQKGIRVRKDID